MTYISSFFFTFLFAIYGWNFIASASINRGRLEIDDVSTADFADFPFVGKVFSTQKGTCSGTLIDPDFVLTSSHCFESEDLSSEKTEFKLGCHGAVRLCEKRAFAIAARGKPIDQYDYAKDWAILKLKRPIRNIQPVMLFEGPLFSLQKKVLHIVGFAADPIRNFSGHQIVVSSCFHFERYGFFQDLYLRLNCYSAPGMSGGPVLFQDEDGQWQQVALNTAILPSVSSFLSASSQRFSDTTIATALYEPKLWLDKLFSQMAGYNE